MKKLSFKLMLLLMGVLAISVFTSCSDDDDDDEKITKANIVGKWVFEKNVVDGKEEVDDNDCPEKKSYVEFLTDGTVKDVWYNYNCEEKIDTNESWKLDKDIFILFKEGRKKIYTVKTLNSTTLILHWDKAYEDGKEVEIDWDDDENDGGDDVTFYLKKMN